MTLLLTLSTEVRAAAPDLTAPGVLVDTTYTYNLGPTGARGWFYSTGNEWLFTPEGLTTESRQIKVTHVDAGSPSAGILQVDDVILGASGTAAAPVAFTSDSRKSLGLAIGEAEKTANAGALKLLIWRGGVTQTVQVPLQVMGTYSATAPYNCPKSAAIISEACALLATRTINSGYTEGNAVIGLALLACVSPTDPYYATVQTKVQTYARQVASQNLDLTIPVNGMVAWPWGYNNVFLSEYYLATGDAQVLPAIRELTATCATGQSLFGTYGHGMAWSKSDGSSTHGYVPPYGPVNQAGETVNLGIMLGKKAIAASSGAIDPEIEPAIERGRRYFAYFAGKGAVPYGHSPPEDLHDDNGKNGLASLLMALQDQADMSAEAKYFAKSCTAAYSLREMGHAGPYYAHLWQPLGANVGGPAAMAAYFQQIQWELDLVRRWDGTFAYHSATGATATATGLGTDSDTASFLLTYAAGLQRIFITGKNQSAANHISAGDVNEAIADGVHSLRTDLDSQSNAGLIAFLGSWSAQKRAWAADELASRTVTSGEITTLLAMAANTNDPSALNARKGACQALGRIKPASAATVLRDRLNDPDYHVRYYAGEALRAMGSAASSVLNDMLAIVADPTPANGHAVPIEPVNWTDPYQIAQTHLSSAVFEGQLGGSVSSVSTSLLYPAITAMSQSLGNHTMSNTFRNALTASHVQALAQVITTTLLSDHTRCSGALASSCVSVLSKYNFDEGIPAAMTFLNQEYGRAWPIDPNTCQEALKKYGSAAAATLPALYSWNGNGYDLTSTISTIQNDTAAHTLLYFKTINTCTASPTTVALPLGISSLAATASDIDGNSAALVYTWSKFRGAGAVTFGSNGTTASNNTIATFDTPGTYIVRLSVTDGILDPNKYGGVTRDLTITVNPDPNRPPVAINQNVTTPQDTARPVTLTATDADANPLTYSVVSGPASGALSGTAPNLTYTPAAGFIGNTGFTFMANDGTSDSSIATVTITVGGSGNTTPVALNQSVTTVEDTAKVITLAGTDADPGDTLTYSILAQPSHGSLSGSAPAVTYTPAANHTGSDSFTFLVTDNNSAASAIATVAINVTPTNDAPAAVAQILATPEDTAIPITLAGTDPEGYAITYQLTGSPAHGTLSGIVPNLTYTPAALYNGADSLSFTVTDSEGVVSATATVSITVSPVNQAPVALNRGLPVTVGTATAFVLNGTDADNNPLTYALLSQPAHGTLTGTAPNLTYTPIPGYDSIDSFTFEVNDGTVDSNIATVFLSMGAVSSQVYTECYLWPGGYPGSWPDVSTKTPDATRFDADLNIGNNDWPQYFDDHFSSRHTGYINVPTTGNYTFILGADDNTRLWIDETLVIEQFFPQSGSSGPLSLKAGYHSIRLEFVEGYGENHFTLYWSGPSISQQVVPASVLFHCVGSTAPVAPGNLTATALDSRVALAWSASPFATSYTLKRSLTAGGPYTDLATALATTSYQDTTVANGTTYCYVVTATGAGGTSFNSNEAVATPVTAPVTINLDYHPSLTIYMNGIASNSVANSGTASRAAPLDYDGINAANTAVNFWNSGTDGNAALANLKNSEGVTQTGVGVSAMLVTHGSASNWGGLGVAPNGARLLKGGLQLSQSPNLATYKTLFKLTGLSVSHRYDLALASQYNTDNRSTSYRVGLVSDTVENGGGDTDWREGTTYASLTGLIPNSAGEIHVQARINTDWAPLNGWQLVDKGVRTAGANSFTTIDSCTFGALGAAAITDNNITLTVPFGTAIGALTPVMVASAGATISPTGPQNFASPVTYRVTAEIGGNYQDYTVTFTVAPNVTFSNAALAVTASSAGSEILSTGTLVEANHFFRYVVEPITLANGLIFGTDWSHTSPDGLSASHQRTDSDAHGHVPLLNDTTAFGRFMRSYSWSSSQTHYLDIPGLVPGHTYRLQLISSDGASAGVSVEQAVYSSSWTGNNKILTATWTQGAGDYVANVVLTRLAGELEMTAYSLHDVTPGFQPSPTGLAATAGDASISLSWDVAPGATGYAVKRSTATGGPYTVIANLTGTSFLNAGLSNGTRYYYVVSATTALGETPNSAQASALPTLPATLPPAPANLTATPGSNSVNLTWTASNGAFSYTVKRTIVSGGPYATLASSGGTSYADHSAVNGTTYHYVVSATNATGEGANSGEISATPAASPSATTLASSLGASGAYGSTVAFTATVTAGATGTVTFLDGVTVMGTATLSAGQAAFSTATLAMGSHSITASYGGDSGFPPSDSAALAYSVTAKPVTITGVTAGNKEYDGTTAAILTGGTVSGVVSGETVTVVAGTGAFASAEVGTWAVTANGYSLGGAHAGNYLLSAQPAVPAATISSPLTVTFATTALNVTAAGTGAEILNTGTLIEANHVGQTTPAAAITLANGLTFGGSTASMIRPNGPNFQAEWEYNGTQTYQTGWGHNSSNNRGYAITNAAFDHLMDHAWWIAYSGSRSDLAIGGLVIGRIYRLQLISENPQNGTVSVEGSPATTWSGANTVMSATWTAQDTTLNMQLSRKVVNRLTGAGQGGEVFFQGYALHDVTSLYAPATPAGLVATAGSNTVALTWSASAGATGYKVKRATTSGGPFTTTIASPAGTSYADASALNGTTYYYVVSATHAAMESADSSQVSALPALQPSATALLSSPGATGVYGTSVTFTATVTPTATGTVTFMDGATELGTETLDAGQASLTTSALAAGSHAITASFGGNSDFAASGSATLDHTVSARPVTVTAVTATKTYDGTTTAPGTPVLTPPLVDGDEATVLSQSFQNPGAGTGKVLVPFITINDGNGGNNYAVTLENNPTGVIGQAPATITLGDLTHAYDGFQKAPSVTTAPAGRSVSLTYNGSTTEPADPGSYPVVATITDPNYTGTASATMVIAAESIASWRPVHFTAGEITAGLAADGEDPDGDGFTNLDEYTLGTDPRAFTPPPLAIAPAAGNQITLTFVARTAAGGGYAGLTRKYAIEWNSDPGNPNAWQAVNGHANIAGVNQNVIVTLPGDAPRSFYRLNVRLE
jgi:fibronectin type 3 domain-containing protein